MRLREYNYTALEHPPTWQSMVRNWRETWRGRQQYARRTGDGAPRPHSGVVGVSFFAIVAVMMIAATGWFGLVFCTATAAGIVVYLAKYAARQRTFLQFAADNGLEYIEGTPDRERPGMVFRQGENRQILAGYRLPEDGEPEIANYSYTTGSGKQKVTAFVGFISLPLRRHLPHIVLDARSNNLFRRVSNLPEVLAGHQKLSLEGDFDQHFTVYAPSTYERDALYVLTPDLMQLLVDEASDYDVEIVDDRLYLYNAFAIDLYRPEAVKRALTLASRISEEFERNVSLYADERVGTRQMDVIAPHGSRLKTSYSPIMVLVIILALAALVFVEMAGGR